MLDDLFDRDTLTSDQLHLLFPELALYNSIELKTSIQWKLHDMLQVHCLNANDWTGDGIASGATALWLKIMSKPAIPLIRQKKKEFVNKVYQTLQVRSKQCQSPLEKLYLKMNGTILPVSSTSSFPVPDFERRKMDADQQYKCYVCSLEFVSKDDLVNHFSVNHNSLDSAPLHDQTSSHLQSPNSPDGCDGMPRRARGRPRKYSQQFPCHSSFPIQPLQQRKGSQSIVRHHISNRRRKPYKPTQHRTPVEHEVCQRAIEEVDKNFRCKLCGYSSPYMGNMRKHVIRRHTDIRPFTCPVCDYKCAVKQDFDLHQERCRVKLDNIEPDHHKAASCDNVADIKPKAVFRCDQCTYETDNYSALQQHLNSAHAPSCNIESVNGQAFSPIDAKTVPLFLEQLDCNTTMHTPATGIPTDNAQEMLASIDDSTRMKTLNLPGEIKQSLNAVNPSLLPSLLPSVENGMKLPESTVRYTATGLKRDLVSKKYICNHCNYSTKFNGNLKKHCQRVHPASPWEPDLYLRRSHISIETLVKKEPQERPVNRKHNWNSPRKRHSCPHCNYTSEFRGNISKHIGRVHSEKSKSAIKTEQLPTQTSGHDSMPSLTLASLNDSTAVAQVNEGTAVFPETI